MATKEPREVCIFTNDSFNDDWVKNCIITNLKDRLMTFFSISLSLI